MEKLTITDFLNTTKILLNEKMRFVITEVLALAEFCMLTNLSTSMECPNCPYFSTIKILLLSRGGMKNE